MIQAKWRGNALVYALLMIGVLLIVFPMYLTVITAFKTAEETAVSFFAPPGALYTGNFEKIITSMTYPSCVLNSTVITVCSLAFIVLLVPMASYAFSRNDHSRLYKALYVYILMGLFVPFQVIMIPVVRYMNGFGLTNQTGIVILYVTLAFAQGVFLCTGYLRSISREIEEASRIDGCSVFGTYFRIVYPLMRPIVVTLSIIDALWIWNDFLLPLVMLNKTQLMWTLPLFQYNFKSQYSFDYNLAFASFLLAMLPIMLVYAFLQRQIIGGLTEGAVKF